MVSSWSRNIWIYEQFSFSLPHLIEGTIYPSSPDLQGTNYPRLITSLQNTVLFYAENGELFHEGSRGNMCNPNDLVSYSKDYCYYQADTERRTGMHFGRIAMKSTGTDADFQLCSPLNQIIGLLVIYIGIVDMSPEWHMRHGWMYWISGIYA